MKRIRVSCNRRIYYYACHEMIFAESAGSYTYIYLTGNRKVKHCTRLKLFSLQLDETQFLIAMSELFPEKNIKNQPTYVPNNPKKTPITTKNTPTNEKTVLCLTSGSEWL